MAKRRGPGRPKTDKREWKSWNWKRTIFYTFMHIEFERESIPGNKWRTFLFIEKETEKTEDGEKTYNKFSPLWNSFDYEYNMPEIKHLGYNNLIHSLFNTFDSYDCPAINKQSAYSPIELQKTLRQMFQSLSIRVNESDQEWNKRIHNEIIAPLNDFFSYWARTDNQRGINHIDFIKDIRHFLEWNKSEIFNIDSMNELEKRAYYIALLDEILQKKDINVSPILDTIQHERKIVQMRTQNFFRMEWAIFDSFRRFLLHSGDTWKKMKRCEGYWQTKPAVRCENLFIPRSNKPEYARFCSHLCKKRWESLNQ